MVGASETSTTAFLNNMSYVKLCVCVYIFLCISTFFIRTFGIIVGQ